MSDEVPPLPRCLRCSLDLPIGTERCPQCNTPLFESLWPASIGGIVMMAGATFTAWWWRSLDWLVFLGGMTLAAIVAAIVVYRRQVRR